MPSTDWLIAGLGNPGPRYAHNRHNVGYWCVNRLARLHGIALKARTLAAIGEGRIGGTGVTLLKPRTYVNASGRAVAAALRHTRVDAARVIVICDDLDLPPGKLRIRNTGGHGGHNGLRSIVATLGTQDFPRIRIGIGRPLADGQPSWNPEVVALWVLGDPPPSDAEALHQAVAAAAEAVEMMVREGVEAAMNWYNR